MREALAVVWGSEKFHLYLVGTKFTIVTDHKALEIIYNTKSKMPARIERWGLRLQQYDFDIQHRPGVGNPADVLSRQLLHHCSENNASKVADQYVNFLEQHSVPVAMNVKDIMVATKTDHQLQNAIANIQSGKWIKASDLFSVRHELSVTNNEIAFTRYTNCYAIKVEKGNIKTCS